MKKFLVLVKCSDCGGSCWHVAAEEHDYYKVGAAFKEAMRAYGGSEAIVLQAVESVSVSFDVEREPKKEAQP